MKKIVGTIAAVALVAASAFAEVNVGMGFNRGFFTPIAWDGDAKADISTSWGAQPRIGVSFSAASESCGVVADVKFDGGNVAVNDNAYIWVKPWSWLKLNIGQSFDDTLRGNACFGAWDWLRPGNIIGEDLTFARVCNNPLGGCFAPLQGAIVMIDPIEGLHFSVAVPVAGLAAKSETDPTLVPTGYINDTWGSIGKKIQVQAGYTIPNVMQIKAQWIGNGANGGVVNAAVALKCVEGMTLDIGAFIPVNHTNNTFTVAAFWGMAFGSVNVNVNAKAEINTTTTLTAGAGVGFDIGNGLNVALDVRYSQAFSAGSTPALAFAAFLDKGIANGSVGIGFQGACNTDIQSFSATGFTCALPIRVQCFF